MIRELRGRFLLLGSALLISAVPACMKPAASGTSRAPESHESPSTAARPAVIGAQEGERRYLRGGVAPLLIKVDPLTTGSRRMVVGSSDLPPGDRIAPHRHLAEDEIIVILRGTARVRLNDQQYTATTGGTVFIPQGTCIELTNIGSDTLSNVFVFSSPGFERALREVSSREGEAPKVVSPSERAAAFHKGHAETDC